MNRPVVVVTTLAAAALLSGCQLADATVDLFGPTPDEELLALATQADADAAALQPSDPQLAKLRAFQADQLFAEISRVCGTENGQPPRSCEIERAPAPAEVPATSATEAAEQLLAGTAQAPGESAALLIAQAIDLRARAGADISPQPLTLDGADTDTINAAEELLDWEYGVVYGLDFARAYAPNAQEATIDTAIDTHEGIIAELKTALSARDSVPAPAPAYTPAGLALPADAPSAQRYYAELSSATAQKFRFLATTSPAAAADAAWRDWLVWQAAALSASG